jgi:hypothetical protein
MALMGGEAGQHQYGLAFEQTAHEDGKVAIVGEQLGDRHAERSE